MIRDFDIPTFESIIGYKSIVEELKRYCDMINNEDKYLELGINYPNGILLYGEPGVGKTLMANAFIEETRCSIPFIIRNDKPHDDLINYINEVFTQSKTVEKATILIDDIDKFAGSDDEDTNSDVLTVIQSCIDKAKHDKIFILATANNIHALPRSLRRKGRFDQVIEVPIPEGKDAADIVKYYLSKLSYVDNVDAEEISKILNGSSCATLESVIKEAGINAAYQNKTKIDMDDIVKACLRVLFDAPETILDEDNCDEIKIAYHEAGHAVVSEVINPNSVNLVSIQQYEGSIGGFTSCYLEDNTKTQQYIKDKVACTLAGRAAIELKYGTIDSSAANDIFKAHNTIYRNIDRSAPYGFENTKLLPLSEVSESTKANIERCIAQELNTQYLRAKEILANNNEFLNDLTAELLVKKSLTRKDIQAIKSNVNNLY